MPKPQTPKSNKTPNHKIIGHFGIFKFLRFSWALGFGFWVLLVLFAQAAMAPITNNQVTADPGQVAVD